MAKGKTRLRPKRSDEELRRASLSVQYEVVTLAGTLITLLESSTTIASADRERCVSNALLHSLLLASRSLLSFLYSYNPRPTDIIAEDFFDQSIRWHDARPDLPEPAREGELTGRISKRLAHLTWERADATKPTWGVFPIAWIIMEALQAFVGAVAEKRVHAQLREDVAVVAEMMTNTREQYGGDEGAMGPLSAILEFTDEAYFEGRDPFALEKDE